MGKFVLSFPAPLRHGRARQISVTGPCGDCRRVLRIPGPRGQYSGNIRFFRETRGTRLGGRHVAKHSSDPLVAYPEVKIQVRDLVQVVGIVVPFAPRGSVSWENSFYRAQGGKWAQEACALSSGTPRKSQAKFRD